MGLSKYKLGDYVELHSERCEIPNLTEWEVSGINKDKEFFEPSKQIGADTSNYRVVPAGYFACNLMHVGRDKVLPIALNHTANVKYVSPAYTVFKIKENAPLLKEYFFVMLKSSEQDRYFWFHTDSSVRDGMSWQDFCDIKLPLPPLDIQQKYVDIYNAMQENQQSYEQGLADLKLVCDAYIEKLRRELPSEKIGAYIEKKTQKNTDGAIDFVMGLSTKKVFREAQSRVNRNELEGYKIVEPGNFAFVPTTDTWKVLAFALNTFDCDLVVSPIYVVFGVNTEKLLPEYLAVWLSRKEFDRYARFHSWGSARENFSFEDMQDVQIPIPDIEVQKSIAEIYKAYNTNKEISDRLKSRLKDLSPILIKGSIEEAEKLTTEVQNLTEQ